MGLCKPSVVRSNASAKSWAQRRPQPRPGILLWVTGGKTPTEYIFSELTRQRLPPVTHTDALFANQSQSILDDLVASLGQSSVWNCSDPERRDPQHEWVR